MTAKTCDIKDCKNYGKSRVYNMPKENEFSAFCERHRRELIRNGIITYKSEGGK